MAQPGEQVQHLLRLDALWQRQRLTRQGLTDRGEHLPPEHRHDHPSGEEKAVAHRHPAAVRAQPTTRHEAVHVRRQHQGLAPRVQGREDAWLRAQVLGIREQGAQSVAYGLKQQGGHHRHVGQPERVQVMRQGADHVIMVTGQQPGALQGQPPLGLEVRALRTRPVPTGVVPDARHMAVRTGLDMATERRGPTLHDGTRRSAHVGGQGMGAFVLGIA